MSRAYTEEEARAAFLDQVRVMVHFWAGLDGHTDKEKCEGVAFSIMNIIDGTSSLPAFDLVLRPHPDDKQFHIQEDSNYFHDGMVINDCYLHECLWRSKGGYK